MKTQTKWMLYGAYGVTGRIITAEAVRRGLRPVLAGRSAEQLKNLAVQYGLEWVNFELEDESIIDKALAGTGLVLNTAGPFEKTAPLLACACIRNKAHYLDISNEIKVIDFLLGLDEAARQAGIAIIPGVGYGTVATNFLAKQLAGQMPDATHLEIANASYNAHTSPAVARTILEGLAGGGWVYRDGKRTAYRLGRGLRKLALPSNAVEKTLMPAPVGDLVAARLVTGIDNITASIPAPLGGLSAFALPIISFLLRQKLFKAFILNRAAKPKKGVGNQQTTAKPDQLSHSYTWVRVSNRKGQQIEGWLEMGEGYHFTALSSLNAVEEVLVGNLSGTLVPAQAFRPGFLYAIEGVRLKK